MSGGKGKRSREHASRDGEGFVPFCSKDIIATSMFGGSVQTQILTLETE